MMKAQGSLEYLIIVAAVLAISAVVVLFLSGAFGSMKADVSKCKAAAAQCSVKLATGTAACSECDAACVDSSSKDLMSGTTGYGLGQYYCKRGRVKDINPAKDANLIGLWPFDEGTGTAAVDWSGNGHNATLFGATWNSSGAFGAALNFNGISDYALVINSLGLSFPETAPMTIEAWINPRATTFSRRICV